MSHRQAIDVIYDAVLDDEAYSLIPDAVGREVRASAVVITEFDRNFSPRSALYSQYSAEMNQFYFDRGIAKLDVWTPIAVQKALWDRAVVCDSHVSAESFIRTPFYNEFFRHFGADTARCLGAALRKPGGLLGVGLHRGFRDASFTVEETARLSALLPHLRRLSILRERLAAAQARQRLQKLALDAVSYGIMVTDGAGRIQLINARAEAIAARCPALSLSSQQLAARDPRQQAMLQALVHSAATRSGGQGGACRLRGPGAGNEVKLMAIPMPLYGGAALVLLDDEESKSKAEFAPLLTQLYRLTPAEAELATLLAQGASTSEAAQHRQVSVATVRTQIKQLLTKTESRRLSDLTRLLAQDRMLLPRSHG